MSDKLDWNDQLERVATALEEGNTLSRQWIESQTRWRDEAERINDETREWQKAHELRLFDLQQDFIDWQKSQNDRAARMYMDSLSWATESGGTDEAATRGNDIKTLAKEVSEEQARQIRLSGGYRQ